MFSLFCTRTSWIFRHHRVALQWGHRPLLSTDPAEGLTRPEGCGSEVLVLCRRAVDWSSAIAEAEDSHFSRTYPLSPLLLEWHAANPGLTFHAYRHTLQAIAAASWQAGGARVLRNEVAMLSDEQLPAGLLAQIRQADWVIPIDDDDWLSPTLPNTLVQLSASADAGLAIWDVLPLHVDADHCFVEPPRLYLNPDQPLSERVVFSCGYALSGKLIARLSDEHLALALLHHGLVSSLLASLGTATVVPDVQAVYLRHPATAGSALEQGRQRQLMAFPVPSELIGQVPWALPMLQAMRMAHQHAVAMAEALNLERSPAQPEEPWVELPPGQPRLPLASLQQLLERQGLNVALAQALVLDEAERAIALTTSEQQALQDQQAQRWRDEHDGKDPCDQRERADLEQRQSWLERQNRLQRFRELCFGDEVELRYLERKAELDRVVYSVLQVVDPGLAEELYQQIREGEQSFADLAAAHSLGREAQSRGQIGPEPLGDQHPEVASRLRSGKPGQLWPPFEVEGIWVVLRLETAALAALDEPLRQRLLQELMDAWMEERTRQILAGEALPPLPLPKGMEAAA